MGQSGRLAPSNPSQKAPNRSPGPGSTQSHPAPDPGLLQDLATAAAILLSVLLAYSRALHGGLVWDDAAHITSPALQSLHGLWRIWFELGATQQYYPLLHSAFWIEHRFWGDAVLGYHLVNLVQHSVSAFLIVLIIRRLELSGAWLAGWIFALHPVCVEAVAWISEQKSTLSGVLYFAAALAYLHFDRSRRRSQYFLASAFFLCALMSKSVTATLPAALLVIFWWKRGRLDWRRDAVPLLPWFAIGATSGLFTAWVERTYIGASGAGYELTLAQHFLLTGRMLCFYAAKILWPANLMFSYPLWHPDPAVWWQYLYPLAIVAILAILLFLAWRPYSLRGPLAGFLYFCGTLFPVLGFLHVFPFKYSYVADHFQYLASLGIIVPATYLITHLAIPKKAGIALAVFVLAIFGSLTWQQSSQYQDAVTLYRATLARNPESWMTHNNLGMIFAVTPSHLDDAAAEFEATLRLKPDHAKAHMNLGNVLSQMPGRLPDAIAEYQASLQLSPTYAPAHTNLGVALMQTPGRTADAIAEFQAALALQPNDARSHQWLGFAFLQTPGRLPDAVAEFQTALRIEPNDPDTHMGLGAALAQMPGREQEAIAQFEAVLNLWPDYAPARQSLESLRAQPSTSPK